MRVLVTGVTGRVGRNLSAALQARGDEVRSLVLPDDPGLAQAQAAGVTCVIGDLRDPEAATAAVDGVDAIIHLGGVMLWGGHGDNEAIFQANISGTFNLLNAAALRAADIQRYVFASSDEVYPSLFAKYLPIDENHPPNPYSFYGLSKLTGENMAFYYQRDYSLPVTIARFALVTEPAEAIRPNGWLGRFLFLEPMINTVRATGRPEAADELEKLKTANDTLLLARDEAGLAYQFHYCDVRDLVQGLLLLLDHPSAVGEVFNLSGPSAFAFDQAIPYLSKKTGIPYVEANIPGLPIRIQHSTAKARALLGYAPQYGIFETIDAAIQG